MKKIISDLYSKYLKHPQIVTDSRQIINGCLFFALKGASFDGNKYAKQAIDKGAAYAIIDNEQYQFDNRFILVENVLETLQQLANFHRRELHIPIIGITGTNGKTTTKELIYSTLATKYKTIATKGNLNNHIGVPITLLSIPLDAEIAIIEMGANHPNEIEFLCNIAEPEYGIITNIGKAHLEGFGDFEGVIKTKNELYTYIKVNGKIVFVNHDNNLLMNLSSDINRIEYETISNKKTYISSNQPYLTINNNRTEYQTQITGAYNFDNIMAAVAIATFFKIEDCAIFDTISKYVPENNRSQIKETKNNTIILDAYNANPSSMMAALENFEQINHPDKLAILGDMFELGEESLLEHKNILDIISTHNSYTTIIVGNYYSSAYEPHEKIIDFKTMEALTSYLSENKIANKMILLKGSRGMKMEQLIELL